MKILLVEDHPAVRRMYAGKLLDLGHIVEAVDSLEAAAHPKTEPEVIVCDYSLPGGSARDVAKLHPGIPMVVLSGYEQPLDYTGTWVMKPASIDELTQAIAQATGQ